MSIDRYIFHNMFYNDNNNDFHDILEVVKD